MFPHVLLVGGKGGGVVARNCNHQSGSVGEAEVDLPWMTWEEGEEVHGDKNPILLSFYPILLR